MSRGDRRREWGETGRVTRGSIGEDAVRRTARGGVYRDGEIEKAGEKESKGGNTLCRTWHCIVSHHWVGMGVLPQVQHTTHALAIDSVTQEVRAGHFARAVPLSL